MSARHPKVIAWEAKLKEVFDAIDHELEEQFGHRFELHPNRPRRGQTANPESDGLFNIGASFTPGYGSKAGKGYVISVRMSTMERIPEDAREEIRNTIAAQLQELLPATFPGQNLRVVKDGPVYKITGDLRLD